MYRFAFYDLLSFSLLLSVIIFIANCSSKNQPNEPLIQKQEIQQQMNETKPCKNEPIYSLIPNDASVSKDMKAAWIDFISSGRYRIACDSDADFNLDAVKPKTIESYSRQEQSRSVTSWGTLNYPMRDFGDHLIVIVVDTMRTDANRFGIVIFSPSVTKKNEYEMNWLYQERDLSRASVYRASGTASVEDYTTDGKKINCGIEWNKKLKTFECN